jgi:beta-glucosidase
VLLGNYHGTPSRAITPLEGIRRKVSPATVVYHAQGCDIAPDVPAVHIIPPGCLRPAEPLQGQHGLTGQYFANDHFEGEPALVRVDAAIDFSWWADSPLGGAPTDKFSIRWTGMLVPPVSGTYTLTVKASSGFRLYLSGQEVWPYKVSEHHYFARSRQVELEAGRLVPIQLDYVNTGRDPQVQVSWAMPHPNHEAEALAIARQAQAVVMVMGLAPSLEGEEMPVHVEGFAGGDRTDIKLPRTQEKLIKKIAALGKPVVLVLLNGSALAVNWASDHVPAIVEAWYPGEEGGTAIADVLFGDYNPAGRLPVTFYKSVEQLPPFDDYDMAGRTYRYMTRKPLYAFGYGLSYTRFKYGHLKIDAPQMDANGQVRVSAEVKNVGKRAGDEVVQLYVRYPDSQVTRPILDLRGFARVALEPGESKTVTFELAASQLAYWGEGGWIVEPGAVEVLVGASSDDIRLTGKFAIR